MFELVGQGDGPLHSVHWYRVVLDEGHIIKASKGQSAQAAFNLTADHRWCLTGTPIQVRFLFHYVRTLPVHIFYDMYVDPYSTKIVWQNKLEDIFSLLHFLRVEPWSNWGW